MLDTIKKETREKANLYDIGMFIRLIKMDNQIESTKHLAELITENFNVICTVKNIEDYENMHISYEDAIEKQQLYINDFLPKE
tara:strand:+ start:1289 stop:1537 length:249 start_codon:yes stop_codon:yes gene_type:complete